MELKLSIIIPIYKVEKYVAQCLGSILDENTDTLPIEVIVVNDGTPDNSMEEVAQFERYHSLRVLNQENQGLSMARNAGFAEARGEYIWFIDSDDWLCHGAVGKVMDILNQHSEVDLVCTGLIWSYDNQKLNYVDIQCTADSEFSGKEFYIRYGAMGAVQRFVIRRQLLIDNCISFYPGILHEDGLYSHEIVYFARRIYLTASPIYNYRQRGEDSIMHSITMRSAYDILTVHKELVKFCETTVKKDDLQWFRGSLINTLCCIFSFTWHLRHTKEYKTFRKDVRSYWRKECDICKHSKGMKQYIKCLALKYMPMLYIHIQLMIRRNSKLK